MNSAKARKEKTGSKKAKQKWFKNTGRIVESNGKFLRARRSCKRCHGSGRAIPIGMRIADSGPDGRRPKSKRHYGGSWENCSCLRQVS